MRPPSATNLSREDFPAQASWIDRLLRPLNQFMVEVSKLFQFNTLEALGDLRFAELVITTDASAVTNSFPIKLAHGLRRKPRGVFIAGLENVTAGSTFTTAPQLTWDLVSSSEVRIRHITGLTTSTKYRVVFLLLG